MSGLTTFRSRKRWVPYGRQLPPWPPPRLLQLLAIVRCALHRHDWGRWRVEAKGCFTDWEYVDGPRPGAWRRCQRCDLIEECSP